VVENRLMLDAEESKAGIDKQEHKESEEKEKQDE